MQNDKGIQNRRLQQLYSDGWITRLKAYAGRRYREFGDWEGWFEEAHQNLALKCSQMPIDQELEDALVFAVFKNELVSVKRNRLGYPRPRAWLREFSDLGQDLFEWMCLQKLPRRRILELAMDKAGKNSYPHLSAKVPSGQITDGERSAPHLSLLTELTDTMIEKKECDGVRPATADIDDEAVGHLIVDSASTENTVDHAQLSLMLSMLLGAENVNERIRNQAADRLAGLRKTLDEEPLLSDTDILILRCYYFQGMSQNEVATLVKLPLQKVVRQREAAIKRIRGFMESRGLTREAFDL